MTTYTIPTDVSGGTILVNEGDVFVFASGASNNVRFESASGTPTSFFIEFNDSKANSFDIEIKGNLSPTITIAEDVVLSGTFINGRDADQIDLTAGDNVTLNQFEGSDGGTDTVTLGDNFVTTNTFDLKNGDDVLTLGGSTTGCKAAEIKAMHKGAIAPILLQDGVR